MAWKVAGEFSGELLHPFDGGFWGIVVVVDDDGLVTAEEELENGVAADVTGSAGDQNSFRGHYWIVSFASRDEIRSNWWKRKR